MNEVKVKNEAAVALGRLAAGKPKNYSPLERKIRAQRMKDLRAKIAVDRACALSQTQAADHEKATQEQKP